MQRDRVQQRVTEDLSATLERLSEKRKRKASADARADYFDDGDFREIGHTLANNSPKLSEEDVGRIAELVADVFTARWGSSLAPSRLARLRRIARDTSIGVIGGLITTGALDWLSYAWHLPRPLAAPGDEPQSAKQSRSQELARGESIQRRLLQGLAEDVYHRFEDERQLPRDIRTLIGDQLMVAVVDTGLVKELDSPPLWADGRPIPATDFLQLVFGLAATEMGSRTEQAMAAERQQ